MAILTQAQLAASSSAVYTTNNANQITAAIIRPFNETWISSSILIPMTSSMTVLSSSYAVTASFALNAGGGSTFPYSGSAQITGSFGLTGSATTKPITVGESATASIDCNAGNLFLVQLGANATTRFEFNNVKIGQTGNLIVTTPSAITVASASFSSNVKQASGSAYIPTSGSNAIDMLSFVVDNNGPTVFLVNSKKFI